MPDGVTVAGTGTAADDEAFETLVQIAGRRTTPVPAEILVRHALALPGAWDWPVRRAAFEAILRRFESVRGQDLVVREEPRQGPWGRYHLGRGRASAVLPYDVRLASVAPVRGSCDCADFLRGSLGLCKHLLAVLVHLARKRPVFQRILATAPAGTPAHAIVWDAAASMPGPIDPLEGLGLPPATAGPRKSRRSGKGGWSPGARAPVPSGLARLFRPDGAGRWRLKATHPADPAARMRLVRDLEAHARRARASADPATRAVLSEERGRLERVLRLRAAAPRIQRALARSKRRLYAYQKEGVRRFLVEGRLVLADDMGLGKTTQAIVAASALFDVGLVQRGLFVVPASLKPQWEREWRAVSDAPLQIVEGGAEDRVRIYRASDRGFLVTNYEQVVRDFEAIVRWAPDLVVLDEAQRIKNWATKTALTVKRLKPEFRLVLSGTPMENRLEELASVVEWVDDRALEPKWRLVPWHSAYADGAREVVGARNLDSLRSRLAPVLLRRVRAEVLSQLPARQDSVIPVELTAEQRDAHDELLQPIAKLAATARRRALTQAEFLRLMSLLLTQRVIANGMAQLNFEAIWPDIRGRPPTTKVIESLAAPKLLELRELIASLVVTQKRKVVVFSQWRRMLDLAAWAVSDLLAPEGLRSLFFTGQEGGRRRTQNLVDFHDDPRAAVLFLTDAGGVGLNLQKAANACINLELPWNPAVLEQRIGRIHRLGQKRPIDVYNLVSRACIEERIASLVADKRALFKGLFDGSTDQLRFEGSGALRQVLARLTAGMEETPSSTGEQDEENSEGRALLAPAVPGGDPEGQPQAAGGGVDDLMAAAEPAELRRQGTPALRDGASASSDDVERLFEALTVERGADGGIRIQAPPHAARALVSLFAGMARLLGAVEEVSPPRPPGNGAPAALRDA